MADWVLKINDHSICVYVFTGFNQDVFDFLFVDMVDHYTFLVDVNHVWMGV